MGVVLWSGMAGFRLILALDSVKVTLRAGLQVGRVGLVGVQVHGEGKVRVHADEHVAEHQFRSPAMRTRTMDLSALRSAARRRASCECGAARRGRRDPASRGPPAFERAAGGVRNVAALADRRMHPKLELLGHRDLDLRVFPRRAEHAHALDAAFRPTMASCSWHAYWPGCDRSECFVS